MTRLIAGVLVLTFLGLAVDLRYEHAGISSPWALVPKLFPAACFVFGVAFWLLWDEGGRIALLVLFGLCFLVAAMGLLFHCQWHPLAALKSVMLPVGSPDGPPPLAPMAFALIGAIGVFACWRKP